MEDHSPMGERIRLPFIIPVDPYLKDHHFDGRVILPAAEILQRLAASVQAYCSDAHVRCIRSASFDKFLQIEAHSQIIEACHELEVCESGRIISKLITINRIRGAMIRTRVHAVAHFVKAGVHIAGSHADMTLSQGGRCYEITSQKLYSDLVSFGPSYRNVRDVVFLWETGAMAKVFAADHPAPLEPLGSPFPFDGALHVACAWGQRYHHVVAFPVGFEERFIIKPTARGESYLCEIASVSATEKSLKFDIWIRDLAGSLYEQIRGLVMKDVSGGRIKPPRWVLCRPQVASDA
jgi:hypothetical protein